MKHPAPFRALEDWYLHNVAVRLAQHRAPVPINPARVPEDRPLFGFLLARARNRRGGVVAVDPITYSYLLADLSARLGRTARPKDLDGLLAPLEVRLVGRLTLRQRRFIRRYARRFRPQPR